jgi:hypothetical protein
VWEVGFGGSSFFFGWAGVSAHVAAVKHSRTRRGAIRRVVMVVSGGCDDNNHSLRMPDRDAPDIPRTQR